MARPDLLAIRRTLTTVFYHSTYSYAREAELTALLDEVIAYVEELERKVNVSRPNLDAREVGYHVTTPSKLSRYEQSRCILPPVRYWPSHETAAQWARSVGRTVILQIQCSTSYPLPDHRPSRWTPDVIRTWERL